ncbi:MAG: tRNA pseudouridine(55) synthase TruB [Methylophilaceae bacterium]|jgi:tRNA pseudouridine55 synthase|nr:tRNA pseudouridine(55) synthase TruB [Methylophilaceae bacterium]
MQFRRIKRAVDGVLLLDKPLGYSSNQALQQVKRLYQAAKAGHTGSLDPLATGLLPICLGEATKFSHFLLDADKRYRALVQLGSTTATGDVEGEVLSRSDVRVTADQLQIALQRFVGDIEQVPPMYSALKHQGKALYEYARDGVDIARAARAVTIFSIELISFDQEAQRGEIDVTCSKGTYIRTLAEDIGHALGCGAHLAGLRRLSTAHFRLEDACTLEQLEKLTMEERDALLLGADAAVADLPQVTLDADSAFYLLRGQSVWKASVRIGGLFRIYNEAGRFLGLGELDRDGRIAPKRLLAQP